MDKFKKPYLIVRKPRNLKLAKFSFVNNISKKIVFHTLMRDDIDFASINLDSLEKHFNYSYYFSEKKTGNWVKATESKIVLPEFLDEETGLEYSFNGYDSSKKLIIVFSSSPSVEKVYNYYRTIRDIECNKLFIADESFSNDKTKCSYFIGRNKEKYLELKIISLINKIANERNIDKKNIVLVGSSKGGFAALYYTYKYGFGTAIVGSPTIMLGLQHKNSTLGLKIINNLAGGTSSDDIEWLDNLILKECDNAVETKPNLYYHAGETESRYLEQGLPFLKMSQQMNIGKVDVDLGPYESHKDVIKFFPKYMKDILNKEILVDNVD